jgi:D-glycero-alpha-D-manno-heptose 1-phosphate guanylyltransferase
MINEAIVLAGGLGTRLQGVVSDVPKPMAPVAGKPFLAYLLDYLKKNSIEKVVLAVGYKHEVIVDFFGNNYNGINLTYAIEHEPMGTGGGIANALSYINGEETFLLNGDSFFDVDLNELFAHHRKSQADITLSAKEMFNFDRYGTVSLDKSRIVAFNEKKVVTHGLINGGVYLMKKRIFTYKELPAKFSFEKEILEAGTNTLVMEAYLSAGYFIDIGIPEDYARAQREF